MRVWARTCAHTRALGNHFVNACLGILFKLFNSKRSVSLCAGFFFFLSLSLFVSIVFIVAGLIARRIYTNEMYVELNRQSVSNFFSSFIYFRSLTCPFDRMWWFPLFNCFFLSNKYLSGIFLLNWFCNNCNFQAKRSKNTMIISYTKWIPREHWIQNSMRVNKTHKKKTERKWRVK